MDNIKMPYLPEETLRTQRVEIYLNDLKNRLREMRRTHGEVIENSVAIINEIDDVSTSLLPQSSTEQSEKITKIKKLILEFESAKKTSPQKSVPVAMENRVDIRKILQNFEKLNDSQVLKESLVLFKRAKESLEKIDSFLGTINNLEDNLKGTNEEQVCTSSNLRKKIEMFNFVNSGRRENSSRFASCSSSVMSIDVFHETDNDNSTDLAYSNDESENYEGGYEGDNDDSEYDLLAIKRKKNKSPTYDV